MKAKEVKQDYIQEDKVSGVTVIAITRDGRWRSLDSDEEIPTEKLERIAILLGWSESIVRRGNQKSRGINEQSIK